MRIATWNINGLRARFDYLALWLEDRQPDLVGLQELKLEEEKFPHDEVRSLGYEALVFGQKSWNGVAVLRRLASAVPAASEPTSRGLPGQESMGARLVGARYGELRFVTVYCPNGKHLEHEDYQAKLAWYSDLSRLAAEWNGPRVLCGDFNLCPGPQDTWSEELLQGGIFHSDAERSRFVELQQSGLRDLYRECEPEGDQFSWWDYRAGAFHKNQGLRIDFLLGSEEVVARTESVWTDRDYRKKKDGLIASDHAPVIADLRG